MEKKYKAVIRKIQKAGVKGPAKFIIVKKKDVDKYLKSSISDIPICGYYQANGNGKLGDVGTSKTRAKFEVERHDIETKPNEFVKDEKRRQVFNCQLCTEEFYDQLKFFLHLKFHYEPRGKLIETAQVIDEVGTVKTASNLKTYQVNLHCIQCNMSFKSRKAYDSHVRDVHIKVELNEFSDHEDIMDGIPLEDFKESYWVDGT